MVTETDGFLIEGFTVRISPIVELVLPLIDWDRRSMLTDESRLAGVKFWSQPYRCFSSVWRLPLENAVGLLTVGTWLSLVEHSLGVRGVGSSNLPVPTIFPAEKFESRLLGPTKIEVWFRHLATR